MSYQEQSSLTAGHHYQTSLCPQRGMFKLTRHSNLDFFGSCTQLVQDQSMEQNIDPSFPRQNTPLTSKFITLHWLVNLVIAMYMRSD